MPAAFATLADVTEILAEVLRVNIDRLTGVNNTDVTFLPPEKADQAGSTHLNLYLYLAAHDTDGGPSLPMHRGIENPIQNVPLPLKLYYVLTSHSIDQNDEIDVVGQQVLMGLGMKTLHDHAVIRNDYNIDGTPVVLAGRSLNDGRIEVSLRPVSPEESVNFWSTDVERSPRLAAYYEVRTVLLPPEEPTVAGGPVGDVALGVFADGPPQLFSSSSTQSFVQAAALGGATISVERAPAVAMLRAVSGADAVVRIAGLAMGDGNNTALILHGETLPGGSIVIEPGSNPGWSITINDQTLTFTVQPTVQPRSGPAIDLLPGLYSVAVMRMRELLNEDRSIATAAGIESNRLPFAIAPTISTASVLGSGNIQVIIDGGYAVESPPAEADLSVGTALYRQVEGPGFATPVDAGTFSEPQADRYEAIPENPLSSGTFPVRLTVNGAESQPFWIEVP